MKNTLRKLFGISGQGSGFYKLFEILHLDV